MMGMTAQICRSRWPPPPWGSNVISPIVIVERRLGMALSRAPLGHMVSEVHPACLFLILSLSTQAAGERKAPLSPRRGPLLKSALKIGIQAAVVDGLSVVHALLPGAPVFVVQGPGRHYIAMGDRCGGP